MIISAEGFQPLIDPRASKSSSNTLPTPLEIRQSEEDTDIPSTETPRNPSSLNADSLDSEKNEESLKGINKSQM